MFGEDDLIMEKSARSVSVECSSMTGQLIAYSNTYFLYQILQFRNVRDKVLEKIKLKQVYYDQKIRNI